MSEKCGYCERGIKRQFVNMGFGHDYVMHISAEGEDIGSCPLTRQGERRKRRSAIHPGGYITYRDIDSQVHPDHRSGRDRRYVRETKA